MIVAKTTLHQLMNTRIFPNMRIAGYQISFGKDGDDTLLILSRKNGSSTNISVAYDISRDLYNMKITRVSKRMKVEEIAGHDGVFGDQLPALITEALNIAT